MKNPQKMQLPEDLASDHGTFSFRPPVVQKSAKKGISSNILQRANRPRFMFRAILVGSREQNPFFMVYAISVDDSQ